MANYYHEARKAKKDLKLVADDNKKRREIRREQGLEPHEHPLNHLTIDGHTCKLHKASQDQHAAIERQEGLIPWNGDQENLIDRFDVRSLLDFYRDPPPNVQQRPKTPQEEKLQELLVFESYRDLVRLLARGLTEEAGLRVAHDENLAIRAQRRGAAAAAFRVQSHQSLPGDEATVAGSGMYSAVAFQYGGAATAEVSSSSSDDDDDDDEDEAAGTAEEAEGEAEQDRLDSLAEQFGIEDFTYRLHKVQQSEGDIEEAWRWKPRKRTGRKAARERARRMAGQGLDPSGRPLQKDWREAGPHPTTKLRRASPDRRGGRSRSRSTSASPPRRSAFPALPSIQAAAIDRKAFQRDDDMILDALPDGPDPALEGAQHFPAAAQLHAIIKEQQDARRRRSHSRSRSRDRQHRVRRGSRSRSRSRSREWRRWSEQARKHSSRSRSMSRSKERGRRRSRSRSHSRDRGRVRERERGRDRDHRDKGAASRGSGGYRSKHDTGGGGGSGGDGGQDGSKADRLGSNTKAAAAAVGGGGGGGTASGAGAANAGGGSGAAKTETPAERLKRIMAAQLSKQQSKDTAVSMSKKIQDEKEKVARLQMQRSVRYGSSGSRDYH